MIEMKYEIDVDSKLTWKTLYKINQLYFSDAVTRSLKQEDPSLAPI